MTRLGKSPKILLTGMEPFFQVLFTSPAGWVSGIVIFIVALTYLASRTRQSDMKLLRETNADLRDAINDLKLKFHELQIKVELLEKKNKTLEDLVVTALKQYFFENPMIAKDLNDITR